MKQHDLSNLNTAQQAAVHSKAQYNLVLAGAGSGKTRVLVSRIAWLIEQENFNLNEILAVTFTNKAAQEMKHRLASLLHDKFLPGSWSQMWVGTFHGLCHKLLRRHYSEANLPLDFNILDSDDQARMIKKVIKNIGLDEERWPVKAAQLFINQKKDAGLRPKDIQQLTFGPNKTYVQIYQAYQDVCQQSGVIDFAELILATHELLTNNPELLQFYHNKFRAILVDEFQDTNDTQFAWVKLLAGPNTQVMVVGDDDQSIYGWRGAKYEHIQRFTHDFIPTNVIRLEQNYRSTSMILQAANALIENNDARMGKNLWTDGQLGDKIAVYAAFNELDEARFVAEKVQELKYSLEHGREVAILYRSNAQSRVIEEALLRANINYQIHGGVRFFERAEIKDVMAYLRLINQLDDDAAFERIINVPPRGIGEKTIDIIRTTAATKTCSFWHASLEILKQNLLTARAHNALNSFINLINVLRDDLSHTNTLEDQVLLVMQQSGLEAMYQDLKHDRADSKRENLQELLNAARQFRYEESEAELTTLTAFLAYAVLESGEMQDATEPTFVHLMTLHAAKGLEFTYVFLVGMEEGVFPSKQSYDEPGRLAEERRLCYVGITRAREYLTISYAEIRRQYGREEYHKPSRFLQELPENVLTNIRAKKKFYSTPMQNYQQVEHSCGIKLGQQVRHQKFGSGVVLNIEGSGANTRVHVNFVEHGAKWLVLAYANLEV